MTKREKKERKDYSLARRGHQDPPIGQWPGREVTEEDVKLASGHALDVLPVSERLRAYRELKASFARNYAHRSIREHWGLSLILGEKGTGKSTLASILLATKHAKGWPAFHTGSLLFGRVLSPMELYMAVNLIPPTSCIFMDEAHVFMSMGQAELSRHSILLLQSLSGLRKRNCEVIVATASDELLSRRLKGEGEEILAPFKPDVEPAYNNSLEATRRRRLRLPPKGGAPRGSKLFRLGFNTIMGNPFASDGILEQLGLAERKEAEGIEIYQRIIHPRLVKEGLLLNDSFQDVPIGAQMSINTNQAVSMAEGRLYGADYSSTPGGGDDEDVNQGLWMLLQVLEARLSREELSDDNYVPTNAMIEMAGLDRMSSIEFGQIIRQYGPVKKPHGYRVGDVVGALRKAWGLE